MMHVGCMSHSYNICKTAVVNMKGPLTMYRPVDYYTKTGPSRGL